jgi:flavin-binding protein dodecin
MALGRVARITQVIAGSPNSFDDAVKVAFERANKTLRNITGLKVTEFRVMVEAGQIQEYRITADVIFVLE